MDIYVAETAAVLKLTRLHIISHVWSVVPAVELKQEDERKRLRETIHRYMTRAECLKEHIRQQEQSQLGFAGTAASEVGNV